MRRPCGVERVASSTRRNQRQLSRCGILDICWCTVYVWMWRNELEMRLLGHRPFHCSVVRMEVRVIPDLEFGRCECVSDLYKKKKRYISDCSQQQSGVAHLVAHDILQRGIGGHPSRNREETARDQTRKTARKHLEEKRKKKRSKEGRRRRETSAIEANRMFSISELHSHDINLFFPSTPQLLLFLLDMGCML